MRLVLLFLPLFAAAQPAPALLTQKWTARWISAPGITGQEYGVYHFRKTFDLAEKPDAFHVAVFADNRYKLYVNGQLASLGPARGDLLHWNYEFVDLSPWLRKGQNTLAAVVWNGGPHSPEAQITLQTAFLNITSTGRPFRPGSATNTPAGSANGARNSPMASPPGPNRPNPAAPIATPGRRIPISRYSAPCSEWTAARRGFAR